jgi:hypothetical protein
MTEKSILEQALLQVQTLEEAVKQNAKGILASTMKQELNDLLKESMEDEEIKLTAEQADDEDAPEDEEDVTEPEADAEGEGDDELPAINDEPSKDIDGEDLTDPDEEEGFGDELPAIDDEMPTDDNDMLDMTGASDEEVLKVFKAMSDEDGIIVKKDGENISLEDGEDEYIIKLNEEDESEEEVSEDWNEEEDAPMAGDEELGEEEETVYEIELDGEDDEEEVMTTGKEVEATESARTIGNGYHAGIKSKKMYFAGNKREAVNEEVQTLKKQNAEYKKALLLFKDKLNEVAVFNANLAYATRLFTEHSTTKTEKLDILKRFDTISTINESKNLYNSIKTELGSKKSVTESVVEKIASTPSTSSTEVLSESKVYEAPQFARMKDLMKKLK